MESDEGKKKAMRMSGMALRVSARLMESPGTGPLLFKVATKQLGIDAIDRVDLPAEVVPYLPHHLRVAKACER